MMKDHTFMTSIKNVQCPKNCIGKSPKYTQYKEVIYNEKQHVKSSNMSTVLIRLMQIVRNFCQLESIHVFNLYFCSSVLVSELILIVVISIRLSECWISKQFEDVEDQSCIFIGTCFFLYNFCLRSTITLVIFSITGTCSAPLMPL